ncbi:ferritin-like domain-containing protein [Cupriavidus basilensis]
MIPIYGTPLWEKMGKHDRIEVRRHQQAHSLSQFLHGEQGAPMVSARIVQMVPDMDAKFYAATQTMDEARHVEAYSRLLHEKVGILYPITPGLKSFA